jgi:hypothetical protein
MLGIGTSTELATKPHMADTVGTVALEVVDWFGRLGMLAFGRMCTGLTSSARMVDGSSGGHMALSFSACSRIRLRGNP